MHLDCKVVIFLLKPSILLKIRFAFIWDNFVWLFVDPAYLVVLCEEELVVIDLITKEAG